MLDPPEFRAEKLRVVLTLSSGLPYINLFESEITTADVPLLDEVEEDDLALASACLEIEHDLRARAYEAVERILSLVATGDGLLGERIVALSDGECARAILDLYEVGWVDRPTTETS